MPRTCILFIHPTTLFSKLILYLEILSMVFVHKPLKCYMFKCVILQIHSMPNGKCTSVKVLTSTIYDTQMLTLSLFFFFFFG